ncbi:cobalamin biosynthesis protein CobW [Platysternon megacephalum]|uniref:Cobalamin biosynthesis protein CobW n=1 Tax=Platysternon megacephalum TaxID=55544 RepID=A0A4D9DCG7_9SAUR|nr:cobalamin biosynthesis protein CobW [Platysternon megacephalum]
MASIPQPFQSLCERDTQAEYAHLDDSTISVTNSCTTAQGMVSRLQGKAVVTDPESLAQFSVNFFAEPQPSDTPNYVVTYLDEDYSLAVVGNPDRSAGWVLSRTKTLSARQWEDAKSVLADRGYEFSHFQLTPHTVSH